MKEPVNILMISPLVTGACSRGQECASGTQRVKFGQGGTQGIFPDLGLAPCPRGFVQPSPDFGRCASGEDA